MTSPVTLKTDLLLNNVKKRLLPRTLTIIETPRNRGVTDIFLVKVSQKPEIDVRYIV